MVLTLQSVIAELQKHDPATPIPLGFGDPHGYRGDHSCLAFVPTLNTTVGAMLAAAHEALGMTTEYDWTVDEGTEVYIAEYGSSGEGLGPLLLGFMLGTPIDAYQQWYND